MSNGQVVNQGDWIGDIGTATPCGGSATGAHVHFGLWHFSGAFTGADSQAASLNNLSIGGWTLSQRPANYEGTWTRDSTGSTCTSTSNYCTIQNYGAATGFSDGTFVNYSGHVYVMAGGAPLYVSTWTAVGGPHASTGLTSTQFNSLRKYPLDGTFVVDQDGSVYRFAGGAAVYVSSWANVGGQGGQTLTHVDRAALENHGAAPWDHTLQFPADGTFVADQDGSVYRFAGGAALYVSNWANVGGSGGQPVTHVDRAALETHTTTGAYSHTLQHPADGTFVADQDGSVYRFAGGAALYVSNWANVGGSGGQPVTHVDRAALETHTTTGAYSHTLQHPADGTFVADQDGSVYRFAGGAALYVSNWANVGGSGGQPVTHVDRAALETHTTTGAYSHTLQHPADGTRLRAAGTSYAVVGGAAFPISRAPEGTEVDHVAIYRAGGDSPYSHLRVSRYSVAIRPMSRSRMRINVGPDLSSKAVGIRIQTRRGARWVGLRELDLSNRQHSAITTLPPGVYRVVVPGWKNVRRAQSQTVRVGT